MEGREKKITTTALPQQHLCSQKQILMRVEKMYRENVVSLRTRGTARMISARVMYIFYISICSFSTYEMQAEIFSSINGREREKNHHYRPLYSNTYDYSSTTAVMGNCDKGRNSGPVEISDCKTKPFHILL